MASWGMPSYAFVAEPQKRRDRTLKERSSMVNRGAHAVRDFVELACAALT